MKYVCEECKKVETVTLESYTELADKCRKLQSDNELSQGTIDALSRSLSHANMLIKRKDAVIEQLKQANHNLGKEINDLEIDNGTYNDEQCELISENNKLKEQLEYAKKIYTEQLKQINKIKEILS